jgi:putative hydrolase of the HAD superfamily
MRKHYQHYLFDWGDTLMVDLPNQVGPMCNWPEIKVVEGAKECLTELSKIAKCHVATNAKNSNAVEIRKAFERAGLSQYIDHIFCSDTIGFSKPEPEYFQFIISNLNVPRSSIVMIGDSLEKDVQGALQIGIDAIWFNPLQLDLASNISSIKQLSELTNYPEPKG